MSGGVALIWAQSASGIIGRDDGIPWHVPEDLARFRRLTLGATVVMGRRTWESLPPRFRPLPDRHNVVLSRRRDYDAAGARVVADLDEVSADGRTWVIGGAQVYAAALPRADRCEVTEVEIDLPRDDGDVVAPVLDHGWVGVSGDWSTSGSGLRYRFHTYRRA